MLGGGRLIDLVVITEQMVELITDGGCRSRVQKAEEELERVLVERVESRVDLKRSTGMRGERHRNKRVREVKITGREIFGKRGG